MGGREGGRGGGRGERRGGGGGGVGALAVVDVFSDTVYDDDVDNRPTNDDVSKFYGYVGDANEVTYLGSKFTKLKVIIRFCSTLNVLTKRRIRYLLFYLTF